MQTTGGYRKHKVRELFDTQGVEAAWVLGRNLKEFQPARLVQSMEA